MGFIATIDIEEWFQVENLKSAYPHEQWPNCEFRLEGSIDKILQLLSDHNGKATFFVLAWCAEREPALVRRIADEGHEIASHGYKHELLTQLSPTQIHDDISKSKEILENITGKEVKGYRAPCFSITDVALDILAELGFVYDSSLFPVAYHDRYGSVSEGVLDRIGKIFFRHKNGIIEAMLPVMSPLGVNIPWAGGGYFRLIPPAIYRNGIDRRLKKDGDFIFYIHPWELDPEQPRVNGIGRIKAFRHYLNLERTHQRLDALLKRYGSSRLIDSLAPMTKVEEFNKN